MCYRVDWCKFRTDAKSFAELQMEISRPGIVIQGADGGDIPLEDAFKMWPELKEAYGKDRESSMRAFNRFFDREKLAVFAYLK